jgi:DNA-directed RNA polymerase specialized sigma24 family protein
MGLSAEREEKSLVRYDIEAALNGCTEVQRKRFKLHHVHGYTLDEIAAAEKCGKQRIKKSVDAAMEKVKKYFS